MTLKFYTSGQVAEMLQLSVWTVCKLAREGKLHGTKLSGASKEWKFSEKAIQRFVQGK
jgi:excisionase family DNA binding protein